MCGWSHPPSALSHSFNLWQFSTTLWSWRWNCPLPEASVIVYGPLNCTSSLPPFRFSFIAIELCLQLSKWSNYACCHTDVFGSLNVLMCLVPKPCPAFLHFQYTVLQATESWAEPGNGVNSDKFDHLKTCILSIFSAFSKNESSLCCPFACFIHVKLMGSQASRPNISRNLGYALWKLDAFFDKQSGCCPAVGRWEHSVD